MMIYQSIYDKIMVFKKSHYEKKYEEIIRLARSGSFLRKNRTLVSYLGFSLSLFIVLALPVANILAEGLVEHFVIGMLSLLLFIPFVLSLFYIHNFIFFSGIKTRLKDNLLNAVLDDDLPKNGSLITNLFNNCISKSGIWFEKIFFNDTRKTIAELGGDLTKSDMKQFFSLLTKEEIVKIVDVLEDYVLAGETVEFGLIEDIESLCLSKINLNESLKDIVNEDIHDDLMIAIVGQSREQDKNNENKLNTLLKKYF